MKNLELSDEEYERLRMLVVLGEWMLNARSDEDDQDYMDIKSKVLSLSDDPEWNENGDPSDAKMLEILGDIITPYDEKAMVDLFSDKLAMINLQETHGEALKNMQENEFLDLYDEEKQKVIIEVFGEEHHRAN